MLDTQLQAQFARWNEIMKLKKPAAGDRANCPSGGPEFAQVVWRYVRVLAVAARADGARLAGDQDGFEKLGGYLESYMQLLKVRTPLTPLSLLPAH